MAPTTRQYLRDLILELVPASGVAVGNGRLLEAVRARAAQVFFPRTQAWDNLQKSLKGRFADSVWEHLAGTVSEPFIAGPKKRIAVKVIDERGNELMVVRGIG